MKVKVLAALLIFMGLNGCSSPSLSTQAAIATPSETPTSPVSPTRAPGGAPTIVAFTATSPPAAQPDTAPTKQPAAAPTPPPSPTLPAAPAFLFSYPIGTPGNPLGDGFFI